MRGADDTTSEDDNVPSCLTNECEGRELLRHATAFTQEDYGANYKIQNTRPHGDSSTSRLS